MGLFTLLVSAILVIVQFTSIILDRSETTWGFYFLHARPDVAYWRAALDRILSSNATAPSHLLTATTSNFYWVHGLHASNTSKNTTNSSANSSVAHWPPLARANGTWHHRNIDINSSSMITTSINLTKITGKRSGILLCLQAAAMDDTLLLAAEAPPRRAYQCLLRSHTPQIGVDVLDIFNPHLMLLAICCLQFLVCLGRVEYKRVHAVPTVDDLVRLTSLHMPLWGTGVIMLLLLLSACALQIVHSADLLRYPTILFLVTWIILAGIYVHTHGADEADLPWELAFHLQAVAVPTALLAYAVFGTRLWADLLSQALLLSAAVNLLWLQLHNHTPIWLARVMIVSLLAISLHAMQLQFGPFDTWRYAITFMACLGLAPLFFLSLTTADSTTWQTRKQYHSFSLMASNAALLCLIVSLSHLV
jgi:hypothetical protein